MIGEIDSTIDSKIYDSTDQRYTRHSLFIYDQGFILNSATYYYNDIPVNTGQTLMLSMPTAMP